MSKYTMILLLKLKKLNTIPMQKN